MNIQGLNLKFDKQRKNSDTGIPNIVIDHFGENKVVNARTPLPVLSQKQNFNFKGIPMKSRQNGILKER